MKRNIKEFIFTIAQNVTMVPIMNNPWPVIQLQNILQKRKPRNCLLLTMTGVTNLF